MYRPMAFLICLILIAVAQQSATAYLDESSLAPPTDDANEKPCGVSDVEPQLFPAAGEDLLPGGGTIAVEHSWPWLVSIQRRDFVTGTSWSHFCTGAIISSRVVATSSKCFYFTDWDRFNWLVVLGAHNNSVLANSNNSVKVESFQKTDSPYVTWLTLSNDIPESPFMNSICIRQLDRLPSGYTDCFMAGWVYSDSDGFGKSSYLTQVRMQIVSHAIFENVTGHIASSYYDTVAVPIGNARMALWEYGDPLMCRNWCDGQVAQWFVQGFAAWSRESLSKDQSYMVFHRFTKTLPS